MRASIKLTNVLCLLSVNCVVAPDECNLNREPPSFAIMLADSLIVADSNLIANSKPLNFQLSLEAINMFRGFKFLCMSLQIACR